MKFVRLTCSFGCFFSNFWSPFFSFLSNFRHQNSTQLSKTFMMNLATNVYRAELFAPSGLCTENLHWRRRQIKKEFFVFFPGNHCGPIKLCGKNRLKSSCLDSFSFGFCFCSICLLVCLMYAQTLFLNKRNAIIMMTHTLTLLLPAAVHLILRIFKHFQPATRFVHECRKFNLIGII